MASERRIDCSITDSIAIISLHRPPVNAIDHALLDAFHEALRQAESDAAIRAVILTSALPGMFCGGMDLKMVAAGDVDDLRRFVYKFYIETMNIQYAMTKPGAALEQGKGPVRRRGRLARCRPAASTIEGSMLIVGRTR